MNLRPIPLLLGALSLSACFDIPLGESGEPDSGRTRFAENDCAITGTLAVGWPDHVTSEGTCQDGDCDKMTESVSVPADVTSKTITTCTVDGTVITTHDYHTGKGDRQHTT